MEKLFITELILLNFQDENITSNSDSEPKKERQRPSFNRSKSLDHQVQRKLSRQESAETDGGYCGAERMSRQNGRAHSQPFRSVLGLASVLLTRFQSSFYFSEAAVKLN